MSRPSRRELLGAAGFTMLTGVAAAAIAQPDAPPPAEAVSAGHSDAELIALCGRFLALEDRISATFANRPFGDPEETRQEAARNSLHDEQEALLPALHLSKAVTVEGHRARARLMLRLRDRLRDRGQPGGYWDDQVAWLLVRDLVGERADG